MKDHVKLLGILNIVWSSLALFAGIIILLMFGGIAGVVGLANAADMGNGNSADSIWVAPFMVFIGVIVALVVALVSLPAMIGGIGLLKHKNWARLLMIVIAILQLFNLPIGTALGVYGLWVLFHDDTQRLFGQNQAVYVPPAPPVSPY